MVFGWIPCLGKLFPPSAHPPDSCPLVWLDGYLNTLSGEENTAASSKGSKAELLVYYHMENVWLNRRKGEEAGII